MPMCIDINYKRENKKASLKIDLKFLRNLVTIPLKVNNQEEELARKKGNVLSEVSKVFESSFTGKRRTLWLMRKFGRKVVCTDFNLKVIFSLGDAAYTGLGTGILWSGITTFLGFWQSYLRYTKTPCLKIIPDFKKDEFWEASLRVKLKIRPYYFLAVFLLLLILTAKKSILKRISYKKKKSFKFEL